MSIKRNIVASYFGNAWASATNLLFVPIYIHYLGIEAYGVVGFLSTLQAWLAFSDFGMGPAVALEMARYKGGMSTPRHVREVVATTEIFVAGVALVVFLLIAGLASAVAQHWLQAPEALEGDIAWAISAMGVVIGLRLFGGIYAGAYTGLQELVQLNVLRSIFATARALGAVAVLAFVSPTLAAYFVFQVAATLAEVIAMRIVMRRLIPAAPDASTFSMRALREIRGFAGGMTVISLLALLLTQTDKLLLSRLLPLADFGHYAFAAAVGSALYILVGPIRTVAQARFAELVGSGQRIELGRAYHLFTLLVVAAVLPAASILILLPDHVLLLWTRDPLLTEGAAPLVCLLTIGTTMNALVNIPYAMQLAHAWTPLRFASTRSQCCSWCRQYGGEHSSTAC
jgi:O-antigen/teichoic acid export membrane protein